MSSIRSVEQALRVLETLARSSDPVGVTEVADLLELSKPHAYRILATLEAQGYAARDPATDRYVVGIRSFELGQLAHSTRNLRTVALPHLQRLNEETGEIVHLALYDDGDVVYIEKLDSRLPVAPRSQVGLRAPASCVAPGRALLAFQTEYEIDRVLDRSMPRFTDRTITDPDELRAELEATRRRGYGINQSSWREGVCGVGAPIRDHTGAVVAAVACCVPEARFGPPRIERLTAATVSTAQAISEGLGFYPLHVASPSVS